MAGAGRAEGGRVGILPGSFNPPTVAHLELARAAWRRFDLDRVVFSLSSVIVDKERVEGLCREDRLLLLSLIAADFPWAGVAVVNRGLYSDQAPAFRAGLGASRLWFIVGMDKVLQIFDPRYYDDRDRALDALFAHAELIAANRQEWGRGELESLLGQPSNQSYRERVRPLTLPPHLKEQSSSAVRSGVEGGASFHELLPETAREFIAATGAFRDRYELRVAAVEALCSVRRWGGTEGALERLLTRSAEPGEDGEALRELLRTRTEPERLAERFRRLGVLR